MALSTAVAAADIVVVTPTNQQGWSEADTRPPGEVEFVADANPPRGNGALELRTIDPDPLGGPSAAAAKAQYLHEANEALAGVTELSYWTNQVAATFAGADPSYQLVMCLNGTAAGCVGFTTLVFEPYQGGLLQVVIPGVWQDWDVDQGLFWSTRTVTCGTNVILGGPGGPAIHTLAAIKTACPNAVVVGFGVNIGTNNPDWVVRTDLFNFNGTTYDFELTNEPDDKDDCKDGGYQDMTDAAGNAFKNQGQCIKYANGGGE